MSKLSILIFGTNQYYEPPQEIITKFIKTHNVENFSQKRESSMSFSYQLTSSDPTEIKLVFLKNLEKKYPICNEADAYVIFIDLECVDALDKLNSIITYIKEECSTETKSFVIGKYNSTDDKIKTLNYQTMNSHLQNKKIVFEYSETCTEPKKDFDYVIEKLLKSILENKFRVKRNKDIEKLLDEEHDSDSNSGCFIF